MWPKIVSLSSATKETRGLACCLKASTSLASAVVSNAESLILYTTAWSSSVSSRTSILPPPGAGLQSSSKINPAVPCTGYDSATGPLNQTLTFLPVVNCRPADLFEAGAGLPVKLCLLGYAHGCLFGTGLVRRILFHEDHPAARSRVGLSDNTAYVRHLVGHQIFCLCSAAGAICTG